MAKIKKNYDGWTSTELNTPEPITPEPVVPEPVPAPTTKKRGVITLNDEVMKEAKKCLKEKGIRAEDVKNLPPIEELCKPIPHSSNIEVHSLQFNEGDIPYGKPLDQCLEELDTFIVKQGNFNKQVQNHLLENSRAIHELKYIVERTSNDIKMLCKHFQMVQTQLDQLAKVQKDMLVDASGNKHAYGIRNRSGIATQDSLYPEGHPKRIEQDSQQGENSGSPRKRKKNKHKVVEEPLEPAVDPNSISVSDAETESGNNNDAPDKEELKEEPEKHTKNTRYTKEDFIANKHGKEREPWVQKPMPFPGKKHKSKEEEH